jgi:hypothetical protein
MLADEVGRCIAWPRLVLLLSLAVAWMNFLLTSRWANVPGTLHGWRRPYYLAVLAAASALALFSRRTRRGPGRIFGVLTLAAGASVLAIAFFSWFPPDTWSQIPFLDNWPVRYQSTIEGIALLRRGAAAGWQWAFLGGYNTVTDITQNLALVGFLPVTVFGPTFGFHLLHALLFAAIPALVFLDLRTEDPTVALVATGFTCLLCGNFSFMLIRSGDTNSLAGVASATLAVTASHLARRGSRAGLPLLVLGLALAAWSHTGFFTYAVGYLALEALYYRDWRSACCAVVAIGLAVVASLPLTWEWWRYGDSFSFNNLGPNLASPFDPLGVARKVYYNVEILFSPGRWVNDYSSLANIFVPVVAFVALQRRSRAGFYAVAGLATLLVTRLNTPQFGYLFIRPVHMYVVFLGGALAAFVVRSAGGRLLAVALAVLVGVYPQTIFPRVPHVPNIRSFDRALIDRLAEADGAMVLLENNPHRNMSGIEGRESERSRFNVHFEALLAPATGKRFYSGYLDGWQWTVNRVNQMGGGTLKGVPLSQVSAADFTAEMRRWGIRHLFTWSESAQRALVGYPSVARRWTSGAWTGWEVVDADTRSVVTPHGSGVLEATDPLGGRVRLRDVQAGDLVVVRTGYFPAWSATWRGQPVPLVAAGGQLAFRAPASGTCEVTLEYPRRRWLSILALVVTLLGTAALATVGRRQRPAGPGAPVCAAATTGQ